MPPLPVKYARMEAAKTWGVPWDEFLRKPAVRRAEMIAFHIASGIVAGYESEKLRERAESERQRGSGGSGGSGGGGARGWDPMAAQRAAMGLR